MFTNFFCRTSHWWSHCRIHYECETEAAACYRWFSILSLCGIQRSDDLSMCAIYASWVRIWLIVIDFDMKICDKEYIDHVIKYLNLSMLNRCTAKARVSNKFGTYEFTQLDHNHDQILERRSHGDAKRMLELKRGKKIKWISDTIRYKIIECYN